MSEDRNNASLTPKEGALAPTDSLLGEICGLIEQARQQTARAVNSGLVLMYWQIGQRIREDVLKNERAEYGKEIVSALSAQLTSEYGRGFGRRNLEQKGGSCQLSVVSCQKEEQEREHKPK